ncbi:hypothetical protein PCASD_00403 [Puccinia coronata f. sp. avenae]|uniref:CxC1-like cysteine cluster associated with KDZ transposases domain-containing protein n=1 Tax=Puccinia coronata f. sp. avenae TaxID=200324 RepID=A0A2N5VNF2_9BASI|nr:hypothetical protein PCASD_00403 [Puccinia coronata f. sp. avenae]
MPQGTSNHLYNFHRASRLPIFESRAQKRIRLASQRKDQLEVGNRRRPAQVSTVPLNSTIEETLNPPSNSADCDDPNWTTCDEDPMSPDDTQTLFEIRRYNQSLIQNHRQRNWIGVMSQLFQAYLYLKQKTADWTLPSSLDDYSKDLCDCTSERQHTREVDLIDLMVWNICNSHVTPFSEVMRRWNESLSIRLCAKNSNKPRDLRRHLSGAVDAYRSLKTMQRELLQNVTSPTKQDVLAQRSCPACFGQFSTVTDPGQPEDNHKIFICMDGNFQHRHHERAEKHHLPLQTPSIFVSPEEIKAVEREILTGEVAQKKTKKAKDRCTEQHKAADDRRNASTWKGCDDTGLFGCCCRHDSVLYYCNIHKAGEGRGLPTSIIKQVFSDLNSQMEVGILYDIGCTMPKFLESRKLLSNYKTRMSFATAVFHSYVHDWPCQIRYSPRLNVGWGLSDGEGLERLWSYLSSLVSSQRYATRNHRLNAISHRSHFHNALGIEKMALVLKRKTVHAIKNRKYFQNVLDGLLVRSNPHNPGNHFTENFFREQWRSQRTYELNHTDESRAEKEKCAEFYERGEALRLLADSFASQLANPSPGSNQVQLLEVYEKLQSLQKEQDDEAEKLGTFFSATHFNTITPRNLDLERRLALLWSAKTALFKAAVELQGEMQPLKDCKARGERLGTILKEKICAALARRKAGVTKTLKLFCTRRTDFLQHHAVDQLALPENQQITYEQFSKLSLDDPFWNDGSLCLVKEPWATDSLVRTGIHSTLGIDRANEEIGQLHVEIRRALSWGVFHREQLKTCIDQCVIGPVGANLAQAIEGSFGSAVNSAKVLLSGEANASLTMHEKLLLSWNVTIESMVALHLIPLEILPSGWRALMEFLNSSSNRNDAPFDLNLLLEDEVLRDQDSDGESVEVDDLGEIFAEDNQPAHTLEEQDSVDNLLSTSQPSGRSQQQEDSLDFQQHVSQGP